MSLLYNPLGPSASSAKRHPELTPIVIHNALSPRERSRRELAQSSSSSSPNPFSQSIAKSRPNKGKNRYSDIAPYDRTRVKVNHDDGPDGYLNASWIEEVDGQRRWIASQAPVPTTVGTFYTLLLTSEVETVVQLTGFVERGVQKAEPYLPTSKEPVLRLPAGVQVRWLGSETRREEGCVVTELEISDGSEGGRKKKVTHMYFLGWPDKGVPDQTDELSKFMALVERTNATASSPLGPPILVHCSAGVGRTGSFISIASLLRLLPLHPQPHSSFPRAPGDSVLGPLPKEVEADPVAIVVDWCREQRLMMVETKEQVDLVWRATREAAGQRSN